MSDAVNAAAAPLSPQDDNQLIAERREKLRALREAQAQGGGVAFPNNFKPAHKAADLHTAHGLRCWPAPEAMRFIADAHLGALARRLRMAGFDTRFRNDFPDREIAALAAAEGRIVLTRDRGLLQHKAISHACYIHATAPDAQFGELVARLGLRPGFRPFTRCMECNATLAAVDKAEVIALLPPSVREHHMHFTRCTGCGRVFWEGSHWRRMSRMLGGA